MSELAHIDVSHSIKSKRETTPRDRGYCVAVIAGPSKPSTSQTRRCQAIVKGDTVQRCDHANRRMILSRSMLHYIAALILQIPANLLMLR